ncbi:MAG: hypothetical protein SF182_22045 [Deltaproteobacteria bacterium]|nr:hypothetical protein [Deltaproteobacteria bacterium]
MSPFEIFNPATMLDPSAFTGEAGASRLVQAAAQFPGGPLAMVFALFWAPVGPGIPAGVLLARHLHVPAPITFGLYSLSDLLAIALLNPLYGWLRRSGRRIPLVRTVGSRALRFAMLGVRRPNPEDVRAGRIAPALLRIATVGFGVDIYTAGALATGLPLPRIPAWAAALAGDLCWFAMLLASSLLAAEIFDDERVVAVVVIAVTIFGPALLRRIFPALR